MSKQVMTTLGGRHANPLRNLGHSTGAGSSRFVSNSAQVSVVYRLSLNPPGGQRTLGAFTVGGNRMIQLILSVLLVVAFFVALKRGLHVKGLVFVILAVDVLGLVVDSAGATIIGYALSVLTLMYIASAALGFPLPGVTRRR